MILAFKEILVMQFHKFAVRTTLAIAATVSTQSIALSQGIETPTHLRLSEIGKSQPIQSHRSSQSQFKNPTQPRLSEIGSPESMQPQMTPSQMVQPQISQLRRSNGQTFFLHPPRLIRVNATEKQGYAPSTYEFTLNVPIDAGQPLKAVRVVQDTNLETVKFDIGRSKAFAGGRFAAGPEIPLASIGGAQPKAGEATIVFDQPVQPGSTVTVALEAKANPGLGGVYQFGVTAFPDGENGLGQFLGIGRINLYGTSH
jgi:hypothetical protein